MLSAALLLIAIGVASAASADERAFITKERTVLVATIDARCDACAWDTEGREAVTLVVSLNGRYSQHVPLVRAGRAEYRVLLGLVEPGKQIVRVDIDQVRTAPGLRSQHAATVRLGPIDGVREGDDRFVALSLAPFLYERANTAGRFSDVPVFMWFESEPTARGMRYRYSVVFTNEDGGTPADRLMATWGRTTDIEYIYSVEVDTAGQILAEDYQGPEHEILPFAGQREGRHPLLWVSTDNNMVRDQGTTTIRYAPAPAAFQLNNVSREAVMDANPWLYTVAAKELAREKKIVRDAPPRNGTIPDPRRFVYIEGCGEVGDRALAFAVRASDQWISSDRGVPEYRITRDGCFRAAIPLPEQVTAKDVRALRAQAFERPARDGTAPVRLTRINTLFMLDDRYRPGSSLVSWQGSMELRPGGPPLEIPIR